MPIPFSLLFALLRKALLRLPLRHVYVSRLEAKVSRPAWLELKQGIEDESNWVGVQDMTTSTLCIGFRDNS